MSKSKIVDAVRTEPATTNVSIPVKMDTSAIAKAIQLAAAAPPQVQRINPADVIKEAAVRIEDLYARFNTLRQMGSELHGKNMSDPLPPSLQVEEIVIKFKLNREDKPGEPQTAVVKNVICVGDLANLLSAELGTIILQLQQETASVKETAKTAEETCAKAREQWEANNPDRKITAVDAEGNPLAEPVSFTAAASPAIGPVTTTETQPVTLQDKNAPNPV
jgi:hypothetical protein